MQQVSLTDWLEELDLVLESRGLPSAHEYFLEGLYGDYYDQGLTPEEAVEEEFG
ncbi:hypothetical protein [Pseudomonas phage vB_PaeM_PAO1_Ab17]|uniref:Uncharacterized protein n=2 Tax=Nankokuvirus Ab03 TaxID=1925780 RepID=A0A0A1IVQ3_9CAUD|nr:hypothetical protein VC54_gp097 [Pseudomonas phage vB_PaeM_PAO1_Ab03]CEF89219.1 hypothetical protein [Pseudomonas phage vB_PaeM_PAO1_Ab03]CEF89595.1 hypothetical protein [Pseudomonas phage vB_PaeM_PAO1_Ab17]